MAQGSNNMSSLEALIKAAQYLEENGEGNIFFSKMCVALAIQSVFYSLSVVYLSLW